MTYASNLPLIETAGAILVNSDCSREATFGNAAESYLRLRGCVSVFDYESPAEEKWQEHMWKCNLLIPSDRETLAFMFLGDKAKANLLRWYEVHADWDLSPARRVVPYVEAGHKGDIPLAHIEEVVVVSVIPDKLGLAYRLNQARNWWLS